MGPLSFSFWRPFLASRLTLTPLHSRFFQHSRSFASSQPPPPPQQASIPDLSKVFIVDTTLREGEQFATAEFTRHDRLFIAKVLNEIGVDYIEVVNPAASQQAIRDCEAISQLGLRSKILTHTRCHMHDVEIAVNTGVNGVNIYMATSEILSKHSHGKGLDAVIEIASETIAYVKKHGLEVRFSCEDSFRSDKSELLRIYQAVDKLGVDRVGIADTVGIATPFQVYETVSAVRNVIKPTTGIEFHTHNDTGCCIANALMAVQAGATHIDTTVLGIGERNGITPLGGFLARLYTLDRDYIKKRYNLSLIRTIEKYTAEVAEVSIPFNNYITGSSAFTHKAGVHSKAVMTNPNAYEVIDPSDFGVERRIQLAHRLTGWNALANRAKQLGLEISDDLMKAATVMIKNFADSQSISMDQIDAILMRLSAGPRTSSSSFIKLSGDPVSSELKNAAKLAHEALAKYEAAAAVEAISSVAPSKVESRPKAALRVVGHLFDKAVLNRLLDILVDNPCEFQVTNLKVGFRDEEISEATLEIITENEQELENVKQQLYALVESNKTIAHCSIHETNSESDVIL